MFRNEDNFQFLLKVQKLHKNGEILLLNMIPN